MRKAVVLALLTCFAGVRVGAASAFESLPARDAAILVDWQYPESLPPRFRNHCSTEYFSGRSYCADHCGSGYQFFYCSEASFGCCHLGRGYCDIHGLLRCSP
jgi:hypothetical protein